MIEFDWFHILRPWWLLAIPAIICGAWLWQRYFAAMTSGIHQIDPDLRAGMLIGKNAKNRLSFFVLMFSLLLTAFALSGPGWSTVDKPIEKPLQATFILLDLSYSMAASDTKPSRYKRAQFKIADFVQRYREQGPFAMIAYAGDAHLVIPLTDDVETLLNFVDEVYPGILPTAGSLPETALAMVSQIEQDNSLQSSRVLLITDGIHQSSIALVSQYVRSQSLDLSILAVGEKSGVPITTRDGNFLRKSNGDLAFAEFDLTSLEQLASTTGSKLTRLSANQRDLTTLFGDSLTRLDDETQASDATEKIPADQGYLFLLLILPLVFLSMRRGLFMCFALLMLLPDTSWALSWQDFWQSREYQAEQLLQDKDYQQVQQLSQDPNKIAAALYGQKQYQQALEVFDSIENATGSYNAGNSLMQLKGYDQAIERYQKALQQTADNAPLKANIEKNLDIARQLLAEQQKQQGQESQEQSQQEQQEQQSQGQESQEQSQQEQQEQQSQGQESQEQSQQEQQEQQSQGQESQEQSQQEQQEQQSQGQESQEQSQQEQQEQQSQGQESQEQSQQEQQEQQSQGQESQEQSQQEQQEQQAKLAEQGDDNEESNNQEELQTIVSQQDQQNTEQQSRQELLLNLVKDNPGELLKRKFQLQQQQRNTTDSHDPL